MYIKADKHKVLGFLKTGYKNLFHRDYSGKISEIRPLCVLDFYVHESVQRTGVGKVKRLFHLWEKIALKNFI
jgi:alpha-tubulin N-acetyltransferase 1